MYHTIIICYIDDSLDYLKHSEQHCRNWLRVHYVPYHLKIHTDVETYLTQYDNTGIPQKLYTLKPIHMSLDLCRVLYLQDNALISYFPKQIRDDLCHEYNITCSICFENKTDYVTGRCHHTICKSCTDSIIEQNNNICPMCRCVSFMDLQWYHDYKCGKVKI